MKPYIVYVSGAPGAGKTTLATKLAEHLYLPHVSSDLIKSGLAVTNPAYDRAAATQGTYLPLLVAYAKMGVSLVADSSLYRDSGRQAILEPLSSYASLIYLHVQCESPIDRYEARIRSSKNPDIIRRRELLLERAVYHRQNLPRTERVIEAPYPTLVITTDNDYSPSMSKIISYIKAHMEMAA